LGTKAQTAATSPETAVPSRRRRRWPFSRNRDAGRDVPPEAAGSRA
jgi:hypothetical protein